MVDANALAVEMSGQLVARSPASKITIPAVKITGDALFPVDDESMMLPVSLCPDPCLSSNAEEDGTPSVELKQETIPSLLRDTEDETEFGAFLLDAVQWL
mmetsp:Transcript_23614/g.40068  ORF Transcript_23614/g.40068 Transcript_23614/m.40068 type:complete len:100 (-) Transcript_23614:56-355(-)